MGKDMQNGKKTAKQSAPVPQIGYLGMGGGTNIANSDAKMNFGLTTNSLPLIISFWG